MTRHPLRPHLLAAAAGLALCAAAQAQEKFTYMTNWYAQAEHGGFYQAVATGIYKKYGLDVTVKMGGPQVNIMQLMAAGQADCIMGSSDMQMMIARAGGLPVVTVAAIFQKDPQVLISHDNVKSFEEMKDKTILIAPSAQRGYWLWLKSKYGFKDEQTRPYTFNIQPFVADKNTVQQGYLTSEPFAIQKAGVKANAHLFADQGWTSYATTVSCMDDTVKNRAKAVEPSSRHHGRLEELPGRSGAGQRADQEGQPQHDRRAARVQRGQAQGDGHRHRPATRHLRHRHDQRAAHRKQNYAFLVDNKLIEARQAEGRRRLQARLRQGRQGDALMREPPAEALHAAAQAGGAGRCRRWRCCRRTRPTRTARSPCSRST
jgi:hypothetical protein